MTSSISRIVYKQYDAKIILFRTDSSRIQDFDFESLLTQLEKARANKFVFAGDKIRYVQSTALRRMILSQYLNLEPDKLGICIGELGRPYIDATDSRIDFNVSHSSDYHLLGISENGPIGVDIERLRPICDWQQIAARCLTAEELEEFSDSAVQHRKSLRDEKFWYYWTAKEAILKAAGIGLRCEPNTLNLKVITIRYHNQLTIMVLTGTINNQPWYAHTSMMANHVISVATTNAQTSLQPDIVDILQLTQSYLEGLQSPAKVNEL